MDDQHKGHCIENLMQIVDHCIPLQQHKELVKKTLEFAYSDGKFFATLDFIRSGRCQANVNDQECGRVVFGNTDFCQEHQL